MADNDSPNNADKAREDRLAKKRLYMARYLAKNRDQVNERKRLRAQTSDAKATAKATRERNRDKYNATRRTHHARKDVREKHLAEMRAWYKANKDSYRAARRTKYAAAHPDMHVPRSPSDRKKRKNETTKIWMDTHPERAQVITLMKTHKRRARHIGAFIEAVDPVAVFTRDKGVCGICHKKVRRGNKWHLDHIVPLAAGGTHCYANVQVAHDICNFKKGATMPMGQLGLFQRKATL